MALDFIPTVWAARLLVALDKALIYGQANVCNRDYEGEIQQKGNTVKIGSIGDVDVADYTKDTDISDPATLTEGGYFDIQACNGSNRCDLFVFASASQVVLIARLDNLGKGASGAAVQSMNVHLGLDESLGL